MQQSFKNTETNDDAVIKPGQFVARNLPNEEFVTIDPRLVELKTNITKSIKISVEGGIVIEDGAKKVTITAEGLVITNGTKTTTISFAQILLDGGTTTNTLNDEQVVLLNGSNITTIEAVETSISDGTKSTTATAAHFLLDGGAGPTNTINEEQVVLLNGSDVTTIEAAGTSISDGTHEVTLSATQMRAESGADSAVISAEGGFTNTAGAAEARLYGAGGVHLDDGGSSSVDITTQAGEAINFKATDMCDVDESGEPVTKSAKVLRGEGV